jgi:hypothetical protein
MGQIALQHPADIDDLEWRMTGLPWTEGLLCFTKTDSVLCPPRRRWSIQPRQVGKNRQARVPHDLMIEIDCFKLYSD